VGFPMKVSYRGFEIDAYRERSLGGEVLLYWSIFRESDQYECDSGFTYDSSPVKTYVGYLKQRVDAEMEELDPWQELESQGKRIPTSRLLAHFMLLMNKHGIDSEQAAEFLIEHKGRRKFHRLAVFAKRLKRALTLR